MCLQTKSVSDHYPIELLIQSSYQKSRLRLEASTSYRPTSTSAGLRVGAFNIRVFGRSKVAHEDVLTILVKVLLAFAVTLVLTYGHSVQCRYKLVNVRCLYRFQFVHQGEICLRVKSSRRSRNVRQLASDICLVFQKSENN